MKFTRFLRFSLCDSIIEFRSKSEIEIQILVTMKGYLPRGEAA
jgi:hypothetical protein